MEAVIPFYQFRDPDLALSLPNHCVYSFHLFPGHRLKQDTDSNLPVVLVSGVAGAFVLMLMAFVMFNYFVDRRNQKIVGAASKFNAVISSLFPENVRNRLFDENTSEDKKRTVSGWKIDDEDTDNRSKKQGAIADLFPQTTIMFADISGFTAWSSTRSIPVVLYQMYWYHWQLHSWH
jgi:hypothetical protein